MGGSKKEVFTFPYDVRRKTRNTYDLKKTSPDFPCLTYNLGVNLYLHFRVNTIQVVGVGRTGEVR